MEAISSLLRRTSIAFRVGAIAALLLFALLATNLIVIRQLAANATRVAAATELFEQLEAASGANQAFASVRYWLTDLAVSMLTISERNATAARTELGGYLKQLAVANPTLAADIGREADAYIEKAQQAVDAYTADNRVIGNTLLSQAREHSTAVQDQLANLQARLHDQAWAARDAVESAANSATRAAIIAVIIAAILGILLTLALFRSIVTPLRGLNTAMTAMIGGRHDVAIPPMGDDEVGRMAQTLGLLKESYAERERLQSEADTHRRTIETAIETISEGFLLFDADDRLVVANSRYRALFPAVADLLTPGRSFREIVEALVSRGVADTGGMAAGDWVKQRVAQHRHPAAAVEQRYADGSWVRISERRTPDAGIVGVFTDVTELKQRQAELEEAKGQADAANKAKSQFLANMSHELRTPLNAIIGYSEMLIEEANEIEQGGIAGDLGKIRNAGRHLLGLINDILDFSKIEAGKMEVLIETVDVAALLSEVEATIAPLVAKNQNTLTIVSAPDLGVIQSDQTKLRQNLFNLLSNACKFTKDGEISLTVERFPQGQDEWIRFVVADSGIGMTTDQTGRLFQAFSQADAATTRNFGGTGLGLAITRHFCRMLGGDVTVESALGEGSKFVMTLPVVVAREADDADGMLVEVVGKPRATILVIDDERTARDLVTDALTAEGYATITAPGGRDGLRLARERRPDAIILDVIMPDIDGWSVLRTLKADPEVADIPVILVTMLGDREMGLALGAIDHLTKPIVTRDLIGVLARVHRSDGASDVLVVDDDGGTRDVLRRTMVREGWTVREAANGAEGLERVADSKPAIILLDLMMPEMNGFEMLHALRQNTAWIDIPVVIITSKDLSNEERDWLRGHTMDVFQKGAYGRTELIATIREMIETARQKRAAVPAD